MKKVGFQTLINIIQGKSTHIGGEVRDLITYDVTLKKYNGKKLVEYYTSYRCDF